MELRHFRYFVAVAEELHFGRAAERLHIVQPALSRQIIALERELGVELFDRSRGVTLTASGEAFLSEARNVLRHADQAAQAAKATASGSIGSLEIGCIGSAMWKILPAILSEHRRRHPDLLFHLHQTSSPLQIESLRKGELHIGFVRPLAQHDDLVFETVLREQFVIAMPATHPLANREAIDLAELCDETFITLPRENAPMLHDQHVATCLSYGFTPKLADQGDSPTSLGMIAAGLGVSLTTESALNISWAGIAFRPLIRPTPEVDMAVAYRRDNRSPAVSAILDTTRDVARTLERDLMPLDPVS